MAYFFHENQKTFYNPLLKKLIQLQEIEKESHKCWLNPNNEDPPIYSFHKKIVVKIDERDMTENIAKYFLRIKGRHCKMVSKDFFLSKIEEWKRLEKVSSLFTGCSASDEIGRIRAGEIDADNYY